MRTDSGRVFGRALAFALASAVAGANAAAAQGVYGTLQLQFQRSEDEQLVVSDSTRRTTTVTRSQWLRALDLHQQSYLRRELLLDSNLRISELRAGETNDLTRTPQGSMRLLHPFFQITLSHQPTTTRNTIRSTPSGFVSNAADTTPARTVTSHLNETLLNGHFAKPGLPQLDLAWAGRRRQQGGFGTDDRSEQRSARLGYTRDRWTVYGAANDQSQHSGPGRDGKQTQYSGGLALHLPLRRDLSMNAQYDGSLVRSHYGDARDSRSESHTAGLDGDWHASPKVGASLRYQWRRTATHAIASSQQDDHDGSLLLRLTPSRIATLTAGGGVRTARTLTNAAALERYVTSVSSIQGKVRRDWSATGSASHTTTWDADNGVSSVQTVAGSSVMQFGRRARLDGSLQFSRNGGAAAEAQRYSNVWQTRLQCTPLRTIETIVSVRSTRVGPGLLRPTGVSRGASLDLHWRPVRAAEIIGTYASNGVLPNDSPRATARSVSVRIARSARWQWDGSLSGSRSPSAVANAPAPSERTSATSRLQFTPSRRVAMSGSVTVRDMGRSDESRQYDAVFVWSFGR